jgi:hypothetical protein
MIKLRVDSRSKRASFHDIYGQVTEFPAEFDIPDKSPDIIQAPGNAQCTCISCCDVASDRDGIVYDVDDLWNRILHFDDGASPYDALSETIKGGLKPLVNSSGIRIRDFRSYRKAHTGNMSPFDNVRSCLIIANYSVIVWSKWSSDWAFSTILMKMSGFFNGGHVYRIKGWTSKFGKPMLKVQTYLGRIQYMSEEVFNDMIKRTGSSTAILCTEELEGKLTRSTLEYILDSLDNLILSFTSYVNSKKKLK